MPHCRGGIRLEYIRSSLPRVVPLPQEESPNGDDVHVLVDFYRREEEKGRGVMDRSR